MKTRNKATKDPQKASNFFGHQKNPSPGLCSAHAPQAVGAAPHALLSFPKVLSDPLKSAEKPLFVASVPLRFLGDYQRSSANQEVSGDVGGSTSGG